MGDVHSNTQEEASQKLQRIEDQLRRMSVIFAKIIEGDFSERPELIEGDDEIARLIVAFRFMMEDLRRAQEDRKNYEQKLEQEVAKKTEELRLSKIHLEKAQHLAHIGSWDRDLTSQQITWSDELYNIYGLDKQTFIPTLEQILAHIHPDDRNKVTHELDRVIRDKKYGQFDARIVRPDGSERILHNTVEIEVDAQKNPKILHGTSSDVTEFKLQEYSLREERDRVKTILQTVGEGLIVVDQYFQIMLINPVAQHELGVTVGEAIGTDVRQMIEMRKSGIKMPDADNPFTLALTSGKLVVASLSDDVSIFSRDHHFPVSLVVTPLRSETGLDVYGLVVVFRNITDEKKFDDAKANFISVASHQLRTPLTPIRWFSEMLLAGDMGGLSGQQRKLIEDIHQNIERMTSLINLLLQIARVESGRVKVLPTALDLVALTKNIVHALDVQLSERGHTVTIKSEPKDMPQTFIDKDIFWQVVQNLLTNAIRYSPRDTPIEIAMTLQGDVIQVAVTDHGIGIPKDEQPRIFEKFYRATNAFHMVPEGTGLGLSLVKTVVNDWGGRVWFETEENKGTTFFFTIPRTGMAAREGEVGIVV